MPGIYGVVNHSGKVIPGSDLARALKHFPFYSDTPITCGSFSGGVISRNTPVRIAEKDNVLFLLYGDIYSLDGLEFAGDVDKLFAEYLNFGDTLFKKLNGEFCIVIWEEGRKTLKVVTDHLGTKPVYYYADENHTIIAPEVKAIMRAAGQRKMNLDAVREFFSFGFCLDDRTLIANIRLALPGHVIEINNRVTKKEYWSLQDFIGGEKTGAPFDELAAEHQTLLDSAIRQRAASDKTLCVSLSGGLDSRTIVAFLDRQGKKNVLTTTFGVAGCLDEKYAREVADLLELPNTFHELDPVKIEGAMADVVYLMDGLLSIKHIHDYPFLPEKYGEWDTHLTGYLGDPIHGQRLFPANPLDPDVSKARSGRELSQSLVRKHSQVGLKGCRLLREKDGQDRLLHTVEEIVTRSRLSAPLHISDYFDIYQRQRRFIAQIFHLAGRVFDYKMPFTDKRLVEFCLLLPTSFRKKQKLARASFVRAFPELAEISWQKTHTHLKTGRVTEKISESVYYFQYALKRSVEIASRGKKSYRPSHIYDPYDEWSRKEFRSMIENILLDDRTLARNFYDTEEIRRIVSQHMSGLKNHEEIIYLLLTFEVWARLFIDEDDQGALPFHKSLS